MNLIKKLWPTPFKIEKRNASSFVVQLIIFIVVCAVIGILLGALSNIAVVGIIFSIIGSLVELYSFVGIILCVLRFIGIIE